MATIGKLDKRYFDDGKSWAARLTAWGPSPTAGEFWKANIADLDRRLSSTEAGARPVINIGAHALLKLLRGERYKNAYVLAEEAAAGSGVQQSAHVVVGSSPGTRVERERAVVDAEFGLKPPREFFFAAVSLEGMGVRFYGEYCMVLRDRPHPETKIVDRDSYEILFAPLQSQNRKSVVKAISGIWTPDLCFLAALKIHRVLERDDRVTTSVVQARALLEGEEYIEVQLHCAGSASDQPGFGLQALAEVRQDARDVAAADRIDTVFGTATPPLMEEIVFSLRRRMVEKELAAHDVRTRVVREERAQ